MSDMPGGPTPPPPPPPPGTPPGAGGLRPRTLGEILSAAFEIYKANASKLVVVVALVVVPLSLIGAILGEVVTPEVATFDESGAVQIEEQDLLVTLLGAAVVGVVAWIILALLQAAIMRAAASATIGDTVDVEASYRWLFSRFASVILVALLTGLAVFAGFFLFIIGALIVATFLAVSTPALVIENRRGTEALKRSWELVSGNFWHVLAVIIVTAIISGVVGGIIGAIGGDNWVISWIFNAIAQIITAPFTALASVLLYLDLRARKEALTADSLRGELASNA